MRQPAAVRVRTVRSAAFGHRREPEMQPFSILMATGFAAALTLALCAATLAGIH